MLRIEKGGTSNLIVTVKELTTIQSPKYLFEFEHQQSFDKIYCILTNISTNTERYDEFTIIDGVDVTFPYDGLENDEVPDVNASVVATLLTQQSPSI